MKKNLAPAVFIGHGAPFYAIKDNPFTPTWAEFMKQVPQLTAVVCISAHWYKSGFAVTAEEKPKMI